MIIAVVKKGSLSSAENELAARNPRTRLHRISAIGGAIRASGICYRYHRQTFRYRFPRADRKNENRSCELAGNRQARGETSRYSVP